MFGSSYSAAIYISRILALPKGKSKVFVLGEVGIERELASEKVAVVGGTDPSLRRDMEPADFQAIASGEVLDPEVGAVLVGLDFHINYLKHSLAFAYLQRGAKFLATNIDSTLPNAHALFPGAGSIAAPLTLMTGSEPIRCGKPSKAMMDAIQGKFNFDRKRACMVGDRLNTDISFGNDGGLGGTLAVLTGVSKREEWEREDAPIKPMYWADKLGDLLI